MLIGQDITTALITDFMGEMGLITGLGAQLVEAIPIMHLEEAA